MARLPRLAVAGHAHLVTLAGHSGDAVFVDDADRLRFIAALREVALQHSVAVEAYVLLDDHLHLLLTPAYAAGLAGLMQGLGRRYGAAFNRRHGRRGALWDGRYKCTVIQPGDRVIEAMLFIDLHGVRSQRVADAAADRWSSARHHLGLERSPLITDGAGWWQLGNTPFEREAAYRRLLAEGIPTDRALYLAQASRKGWVVGDAAFLDALARQTERPLQPRPRGRPRGRLAGP